MRYKLELSYAGTDYSGWQRQDNAITVQQLVEESISLKLQEKIIVVGCGRTDAGVHASKYVLHFDTPVELPGDFIFALNQILPESIAFQNMSRVTNNFHARFDALKRSYIYRLHSRKDPFKNQLSYYFPRILKCDDQLLNKSVQFLLDYESFTPFCKTNSDVKTTKCKLTEALWKHDPMDDSFEFHISSDRFLRGMVRLIVGSSLQVALGKLSIGQIEEAMQAQKPLPYAWSVPAHGLYLSEVRY